MAIDLEKVRCFEYWFCAEVDQSQKDALAQTLVGILSNGGYSTDISEEDHTHTGVTFYYTSQRKLTDKIEREIRKYCRMVT